MPSQAAGMESPGKLRRRAGCFNGLPAESKSLKLRHRMNWLRSTFRCLLVVILCEGASLSAATVRVFAAASLSDSLKEIATTYERQTGDKIVFNLGA